MWGALLAATIAGWLHQLTAATRPDGTLAGHGVRTGKAMIATLRHRPRAHPRPARPPRPRPHPAVTPPATTCSPKSSPACVPSRPRPDHRAPPPRHPPEPANSARPPGICSTTRHRNNIPKINNTSRRSPQPVTRGFGSDNCIKEGGELWKGNRTEPRKLGAKNETGRTSRPVTLSWPRTGIGRNDYLGSAHSWIPHVLERTHEGVADPPTTDAPGQPRVARQDQDRTPEGQERHHDVHPSSVRAVRARADTEEVSLPPNPPLDEPSAKGKEPGVLAAGQRFHRDVQAAFVAGLLGLRPSDVIERTLVRPNGARERADILLLAPDDTRKRVVVEIKSTTWQVRPEPRRSLLLRHLRQMDGYLDLLLEDLGDTVDSVSAVLLYPERPAEEIALLLGGNSSRARHHDRLLRRHGLAAYLSGSRRGRSRSYHSGACRSCGSRSRLVVCLFLFGAAFGQSEQLFRGAADGVFPTA